VRINCDFAGAGSMDAVKRLYAVRTVPPRAASIRRIREWADCKLCLQLLVSSTTRS
jgi:hypothetical protein